MTVEFRTATTADAATLARLAAASFDPRFGEGWSGQQIVSTLSQPYAWGELALLHGKPCGFSLCRIAADEAELLLVAVEPDARGSGIGSALIESAGRNAAGRGASCIHLEMRENNEAAARLYRRFGFKGVGRRPRYYCGALGERYDAFTMRTPLPFVIVKDTS